MKVIIENLMPGGSKGSDFPLLEYLDLDSMKELLGTWYDQAPRSGRPCGIACARTYRYVRTADTDLSPYCQKVRKRDLGRRRCLDSDYVHSRLTVLEARPVLYLCGSRAYDFAVPLQDPDGKVVGVFVDGQLRPRIRTAYSMEALAREYGLKDDALACYDNLPVLDRGWARDAMEFMGGGFADRLEYLNKESPGKLDVAAFRRNVTVLKQMLESAADDGLARQSLPFGKKPDKLSDHFTAVLTLSAVPEGGPTFELEFQSDAERQLNGHFAVEAGGRRKSFRAAYKQLRKNRHAEIIDRDEKDPLKTMVLEPLKACYESTDDYREQDVYWLMSALEDHKLEGVAAAAVKHKKKAEHLRDTGAVEQKAAEVTSYLERHSLACLLTGGIGTPGGFGKAERTKRTEAARAKIRWLSDKSNRAVSLEWRPFLEYLDYALGGNGAVMHLSDKDRSYFDRDVVSVLGSPYFSPMAELKAFACLQSIGLLGTSADTATPSSRGANRPYRPLLITEPRGRKGLLKESLVQRERRVIKANDHHLA